MISERSDQLGIVTLEIFNRLLEHLLLRGLDALAALQPLHQPGVLLAQVDDVLARLGEDAALALTLLALAVRPGAGLAPRARLRVRHELPQLGDPGVDVVPPPPLHLVVCRAPPLLSHEDPGHGLGSLGARGDGGGCGGVPLQPRREGTGSGGGGGVEGVRRRA